jgi:hypothetical protein
MTPEQLRYGATTLFISLTVAGRDGSFLDVRFSNHIFFSVGYLDPLISEIIFLDSGLVFFAAVSGRFAGSERSRIRSLARMTCESVWRGYFAPVFTGASKMPAAINCFRS